MDRNRIGEREVRVVLFLAAPVGRRPPAPDADAGGTRRAPGPALKPPDRRCFLAHGLRGAALDGGTDADLAGGQVGPGRPPVTVVAKAVPGPAARNPVVPQA